MGHVPHSLPGQSQTTQLHSLLHRLAWPPALRPQGRLPRRILGRRSPHRPPANLRGYLCSPPRRFVPDCVAESSLTSGVDAAARRNLIPPRNACRSLAPASPLSQISPASPRPSPLPARRLEPTGPVNPHFGKNQLSSCADSRPRLPRAESKGLSGGRGVSGRCQPVPQTQPPSLKPAKLPSLQPLSRLCEPSVNPACGKSTPRPSIKPVIAGDTTYGVSLLTATISGSNFAIP